MVKLNQRTLGNYYLEWLILVLVIVYLFVTWKEALKKEVKAQPIVIDKNVTYSEDDPSNNDLIAIKDRLPGEPGYTPETLRQPCESVQQTNVVPNLPGAHTQQGCAKEFGLVCVHGVVEGGGICLKNINQRCFTRDDCTPLADGGCLYGFCQEQGEVINKPCSSNTQCSDNGQFNHVCDTISRRCKYGIFPKDSGCNSDSQCEYYSNNETITQVTCLDNAPIIEYPAVFESGQFVITDNQNTDLNQGIYIGLFGENSGFLGRYLITNYVVENNNTFITLNNVTEPILEEISYTIQLGSGEGGGICLIRYPLGSKPLPIVPENTELVYPCETQLKNLDGFCVESTRDQILGSVGEVCNTSGLGCQEGLTCTYSQNLVDLTSLNKNVTGTGMSQKIGDIFIKDIGRCANQTAVFGEFCNESTKGCIAEKTQNICLDQTDINNKVFTYCGRNWDSFEASKLLGCPSNYTFDSTNEICLSNVNNVCLTNNDCLSGNCDGTLNFEFYNFLKNEFQAVGDPPISFNQNGGEFTLRNILMTKEFGPDGKTPAAYGYWYINNNFQSYRSITIVLYLNGETSVPYQQSIQFESDSYQIKDVSIFKNSNNDIQVNVSYFEAYENYTRREIPITNQGDGKFALIDPDFSIGQGATVFITEVDSGGYGPLNLWTLDYHEIRTPKDWYLNKDYFVQDRTDLYTTDPSNLSSNVPFQFQGLTNSNYVHENPSGINPNWYSENVFTSTAHNYNLVTYNSTYKFNYQTNVSRLAPVSQPTIQGNFLNIDQGQEMIYSAGGGEYKYLFGLQKETTYYEAFEVPLVDQTPYKVNNYFGGVYSPESKSYKTTSRYLGGCIYVSEEDYNKTPVISVNNNNLSIFSSFVNVTFGGEIGQELELIPVEGPQFSYPTVFGINIFQYTINSSSPTNLNYQILEREPLLPIPNYSIIFNNPIGFFLQTTENVKQIDVSEKLIIIVQEVGTLNHVTQIFYESNVSDSLIYDKITESNSFTNNLVNRIHYSEAGGQTQSKSILFNILNTFSVPKPKIYSSIGYNIGTPDLPVFNLPYKIDKVQNYARLQAGQDISSSVNEINVFTSYSDILTDLSGEETSNNYKRITMMNETNLSTLSVRNRSDVLLYSKNSKTANKTSGSVINKPNIVSDPNLFGFCVPIEMSPIYTTALPSTTKNYYTIDQPGIHIVNKKDIDVFLKYSSSEIVIGIAPDFANGLNIVSGDVGDFGLDYKLDGIPGRYIVITGILSYEIDDDLNEDLYLDTNIIFGSFDTALSGWPAYIYPNNIVPIYLQNPYSQYTAKNSLWLYTTDVKKQAEDVFGPNTGKFGAFNEPPFNSYSYVMFDGSILATSSINSIQDITDLGGGNGAPVYNSLTSYNKIMYGSNLFIETVSYSNTAPQNLNFTSDGKKTPVQREMPWSDVISTQNAGTFFINDFSIYCSIPNTDNLEETQLTNIFVPFCDNLQNGLCILFANAGYDVSQEILEPQFAGNFLPILYNPYYQRYPVTTLDAGDKNYYGISVLQPQNLPSKQPILGYLVNNLFASTLSIISNDLFVKCMFNPVRSLINLILTLNTSKIGESLMYANTIPYYTSIKNNQGALDKSYKDTVYWPYWITDLNKVPVTIYKNIFSFNPGNNRNDMFCYILCYVGEFGNLLLYLPVNFAINNIVESQPIPYMITTENLSQAVDTFSNFSFMTPYDKKLYVFTNNCG